VRKPPRRRFTGRNHLLQSSPFLHREHDPIFVHRGSPFLEVRSIAKPQETTFRVTRQSKFNETLAPNGFFDSDA